MKRIIEMLICVISLLVVKHWGFFAYGTTMETWKTAFALVGVISVALGVVNTTYKLYGKMNPRANQ